MPTIPLERFDLPMITAYEQGDYRVVDKTCNPEEAAAVFDNFKSHGWEVYKREHEGVIYIIVRTHINF